MLTVTDSNTSFILNEREAIDLELKLNVTDYGHTWRPIGDALYNFGSRNSKSLPILVVTTEQFNFLLMLRSKESWEVCRGLK